MSAVSSKAGDVAVAVRWPWSPTRTDAELDQKDERTDRELRKIDGLIEKLERMMDRVEAEHGPD